MNKWVDECWRLLAGFAVALLAGLLLGRIQLVLLVFLATYSLWMIYRFYELHYWLERGARTAEVPDTFGLASTIAQLVHRERKHRQRQKQKLRETIEQFNVLAAALPDATVVLDDKLQIHWCNTAAEKLFGLSRKRDTGQRIDNLIRQPEVHQLLLAQDSASDIEIAAPTNHDLTILLTSVPAGHNMQILTGRDITQRVQVREMRKAFVADVSHELRTPLTVIQGHMEMLQESIPQFSEPMPIPNAGDPQPVGMKKEGYQVAFGRVAEQTDRMAEIVGDLLTLSKLESSNIAGNHGDRISMIRVIRSVVDSANSSSERSHPIEMDLDVTMDLLGLENEIHSACQNLVMNAIAYTSPGTLIELRWHNHPNALNQEGVVFSVQDHGDGIEPQHVPKLSQRFYRVDKARSRESGGTGLGLAIVKYIAQRHGGHLDITSKLGEGSRFSIWLPAARVLPNPDGAKVRLAQ